MTSIPFQLPDINLGLTEISGMVYLEEEFLVFEVETALLGEFGEEEQVIKVEPSALETIRLEHGVFRDRLCIRPKKREFLRVMPGTYKEELKLKVWRKYRAAVEQLVDEIRRRQRL